MSTAVAAPLAVWDVRGSETKWKHHQDAVAWCATHLPDQGCDTYRLEFYLVDMPFAKAFRYATDDAGCRYFDPATGEAAVQEPVTVLLTELPPAHLMVFQ